MIDKARLSDSLTRYEVILKNMTFVVDRVGYVATTGWIYRRCTRNSETISRLHSRSGEFRKAALVHVR